MKSAWKLCAMMFLATGLVAQTSTAPKPKKRSAPITAADVQALKDAIASQQAALAEQQKEIQRLQDQLNQKDQAVQQAQTAATDATSKADAAQSTASQQQQQVTELKNDVSDLKTNVANTVVTVQETQKRVAEPATTIHFKGITISPGGFLAAESVYRTRALGADINTPFNSVPMPGSSTANTSEFFGSGRQSRISMLAEGKAGAVAMSGYVEADFLSAGVTSNNNESNSYTLRQRQAWGKAALDSGWSFTGGQQWSLVTETKVGLDNRTEALPMTIDPQYQVGFSWARQYGFRVVKNIDNKVWFGFAVENSQATLTSHGNASNFLVGTAGVTGGLYNNQANYSFNPSPDFIAKMAFEPGFGHYEVYGIFSRFRDRVFPCEDVSSTTTCGGSSTAGPNALGAYNNSRNGGGIGANARWSFAQKHVDFGLHGLGGSGVGRYGTSGLADTAAYADGALHLVKSLQGLTTLEFHYPKLDVYFNVGAEYAGRAADFDPVSGKEVGYGAPLFNNSGCYTETGPGSGGFAPGSLANCTADTRVMIEGTAGFWHKIHSGPKGRVQWGLQYSYLDRQAWSGSGFEPHGIDNMVFSSFRYYLP
ncbi:MAG TPA: hypothetical protein VMF66_10535 [Candidatus Acidoferrum sp.]|nr:hypothetical protein [Candidatus Acidoferrum sp.]HTZ82538.1 hypothetical protein [Candidatus Acidoferrales bacterium]